MLETKPEYTIQEKRIFIWVLIAASLAFIWVMSPFLAPILWASILAVLFQSVFRALSKRMPKFPNLVTVLTLFIAVFVVVLPVLLVLTSVLNEAAKLYADYEAGRLDIGRYLNQIEQGFPLLQQQAESLGIDLRELRQQASSMVGSAANFLAQRSFDIGQNTLVFLLNTGLMLYLAFFLLRDGDRIVYWVKIAFPLDDKRETTLFSKFSEVTRATVKGNLVVGLVQGGLGGTMFWILGVQPAVLWGALMAVSSLIPAVGTALIWLPVSIYLFAIGQSVQALSLIAFGLLVIGTVDNVLRPILVGRDTKLPDYVVLFSTLGGLALFGIHGFVVGPLVAAIFFTLWHMFIVEFNPHDASQEVVREVEEL